MFALNDSQADQWSTEELDLRHLGRRLITRSMAGIFAMQNLRPFISVQVVGYQRSSSDWPGVNVSSAAQLSCRRKLLDKNFGSQNGDLTIFYLIFLYES